MILLVETRRNMGHWLGVFKSTHPHTVEVFDPYGRYFVDHELKFVHVSRTRTSRGCRASFAPIPA